MRALRFGLAGLLLVAASALACHRTDQEPTTQELVVRVGKHEMRLDIPPGWRHRDHGEVQFFNLKLDHVSVRPHGPAGSLGLSSLVSKALQELGDLEGREIVEQVPLSVDARPALRVDTWDPLSHNARKRHVLILVEGDLISVSSRFQNFETGDFARVAAQFEAVLASIRFNARRDAPAGTVSP